MWDLHNTFSQNLFWKQNRHSLGEIESFLIGITIAWVELESYNLVGIRNSEST